MITTFLGALIVTATSISAVTIAGDRYALNVEIVILDCSQWARRWAPDKKNFELDIYRSEIFC
jgi:hypothetical protein